MTASAGDGATGTAEGAADDAAATADGSAAAEDATDGTSYGGIFGAFPYAFRQSDSRLFRAYAVVGGLAAALVAILFVLALVVAIAETTGGGGGTFTFARAFFVFLMLLVIAPLVAPTLAVARRHRRRATPGASAPSAGYDRVFAGTGFLFLLSLAVMLVITIPATQQEPPTGVLGPVTATLYDLPSVAGVGPPLLVVAAMAVVYRRSE